MTITQVGFIGLGNMGRPMAGHLADAGFALTVSDAALGVTERFVAEHPTATAAPGPDSFAAVQALILMLPTSAIVEDVLEREQVAGALPPGCLVIDMSSSEPLRTRSLAARLQAKGLRMLDAPVSGGVRGASAARLSVLVGGSAADLAEATPLLTTMAKTVIRVGDIGSGHAAKALNNLVSAATMSITVEALVIAQAFGIDAGTMTDVLNSSSGRSNTSESKLAQFMISGAFDSGFALQLMAKDVGLAVALAQSLDRPAEIAGAVAGQWRRVAGQTSPATDHTQLFTLLGATLADAKDAKEAKEAKDAEEGEA
jgi:3-hydroxyisobutyrate dehydrogenase